MLHSAFRSSEEPRPQGGAFENPKTILCYLNEISGLSLLVIMAACDGLNPMRESADQLQRGMGLTQIVKEAGAGRSLNSNVESQLINDCYKLLGSTQEQEAEFERHKRHFFMMDIFEGYDQRFQITFDQCKKFMQGNEL